LILINKNIQNIQVYALQDLIYLKKGKDLDYNARVHVIKSYLDEKEKKWFVSVTTGEKFKNLKEFEPINDKLIEKIESMEMQIQNA
jgi:hypothetical protein